MLTYIRAHTRAVVRSLEGENAFMFSEMFTQALGRTELVLSWYREGEGVCETDQVILSSAIKAYVGVVRSYTSTPTYAVMACTPTTLVVLYHR
jgi:hypothetical protein